MSRLDTIKKNYPLYGPARDQEMQTLIRDLMSKNEILKSKIRKLESLPARSDWGGTDYDTSIAHGSGGW